MIWMPGKWPWDAPQGQRLDWAVNRLYVDKYMILNWIFDETSLPDFGWCGLGTTHFTVAWQMKRSLFRGEISIDSGGTHGPLFGFDPKQGLTFSMRHLTSICRLLRQVTEN